ncbi:MAG: 1-acyl-sn-glycerol-3-phosphate acyltransferase [Myxococcota bacterium]|jgi:1-acyl-sn-glycerol-3-phosphate acyltransferase
MSPQTTPTPTDPIPDGHRDPEMNRFADAMGDLGGVFEEKGDTVSLDDLLDALRALGSAPGVKSVVHVFQTFGLDRVRSLARRLLASGEVRDTDEFGFEPSYLEPLEPISKWFHDHYFRVESRGVEHIPDDGRVLLVANHSGTLPYDGAMVVTAVRFQHPSGRRVRSLVEDFIYHLPWLGNFMTRVGAVRACQENASRLLENDQATLVFPEGVKGIGKLFRKRYRLQRFGRGGAVKLAMKANAPIIPVSIVGAEESMPLLSKVSWLAKPLGLPYIPVTPTLPLLGPLGLIPLPTKWFIDFGAPIDMAQYDASSLNDRVLINRLNEEVRGTIQGMIDRRLSERKSVFFG